MRVRRLAARAAFRKMETVRDAAEDIPTMTHAPLTLDITAASLPWPVARVGAAAPVMGLRGMSFGDAVSLRSGLR